MFIVERDNPATSKIYIHGTSSGFIKIVASEIPYKDFEKIGISLDEIVDLQTAWDLCSEKTEYLLHFDTTDPSSPKLKVHSSCPFLKQTVEKEQSKVDQRKYISREGKVLKNVSETDPKFLEGSNKQPIEPLEDMQDSKADSSIHLTNRSTPLTSFNLEQFKNDESKHSEYEEKVPNWLSQLPSFKLEKLPNNEIRNSSVDEEKQENEKVELNESRYSILKRKVQKYKSEKEKVKPIPKLSEESNKQMIKPNGNIRGKHLSFCVLKPGETLRNGIFSILPSIDSTVYTTKMAQKFYGKLGSDTKKLIIKIR